MLLFLVPGTDQNYELEGTLEDLSYAPEVILKIKEEPIEFNVNTSEYDESMPLVPLVTVKLESDKKIPAKRGRPLKDGPPRPPPRSLKKKKAVDSPVASKLPRMSSRLDQKTLDKDLMIRYKANRESFLQNGVCYKMAPLLDYCLECKSKSRSSRRAKKNVDCRFYEFRKLVYSETAELEVSLFKKLS